MRVYAFSSLLVLSMLIAASFLVPTHAAPAWTIQTISNSALGLSSIVVDSNNNPHIAYTEWVAGNRSDYNSRNGRDYVIYASWNGSIWIYQTVAQDAAFLDFVLDSNDNAHILYKTQSTSEGLVYASWTGYDWSRQTVDEEGLESSLALDSAGNPHIAYFTNGNTTSAFFLKYTIWTGSSWSTQIVDAGGMTYLPSLKLDAQNHPHIMYETLTVTPTNSSEELKYAAFNNASGWTIQTVGQNIDFRNMVLDSNGYPHFSCATEEGLTYASWNGSGWSMQPVNVNAVSGESYLALDKQNYPHIDFSNIPGSEMYARWTGKTWDIQTVNGSLSPGPIAIDSNGNPHICSSGGLGPSNLLYATTTEPTQTSSAPFLIGFLIAIPVIVVLFVIALVNRWKKKLKEQNEGPLFRVSGLIFYTMALD